MSASSSASSKPRGGRRLDVVSAYDRVVGLVIALVMMSAAAVGVLLFVWAGSKFVAPRRTVPIVLSPENPGGDPSGTSADGATLVAPTDQEIRRETNVSLPEFRRTLAAVQDLVRERAADLDATLERLDPESQGGGRSQGTGDAPAFGSGGGSGGLPRNMRWEIAYSTGGSLEDYAKELDYFDVELAAVGENGGIEYARDLSRSPPVVERDRAEPERRIYMQWREGSVRREADRKLLTRAKVETAGKTLVQFIPHEVEELLARLEYDYAKRPVRDIRRTRFGVRRVGEGYEFFVEEQALR